MTNDLHTRISNYAGHTLDELRELNITLLDEMDDDFSKVGEWLVTEYVMETRTGESHDLTNKMYDLFQQWVNTSEKDDAKREHLQYRIMSYF